MRKPTPTAAAGAAATALVTVISATAVRTRRPSEAGGLPVQVTLPAGSELQLDPREAEHLVARGLGHWPDKARPAPPPARPAGDALQAAMFAAFRQLDPAEDFNADGRPGVRAIERVIGFDITQEERDSAWGAFEKSGKAADLFTGKGAQGDGKSGEQGGDAPGAQQGDSSK